MGQTVVTILPDLKALCATKLPDPLLLAGAQVLEEEKQALAARQVEVQNNLDNQTAELDRRTRAIITAEAELNTSRDRLAADEAALRNGEPVSGCVLVHTCGERLQKLYL